MRRLCLLLAVIIFGAAVCCMAGCARGGETGKVVGPQAVLDIWVKFAGPVDDSAYYFLALDIDNDLGSDFPVPIASGPFWANGWGSGSITHFVQYHLGAYEFFEANMIAVLREALGGITGVSGTPAGGDTGQYTLTIGAITYGAATLTGAGTISDVDNGSGQNAGVIALQTDASGETVAGSVSFTPAANGGAPPTVEQMDQISALNAGGALLGANSLSDFGLALTLGAPAAGAQSITIAPSVASVTVEFVPTFAGVSTNTQATLRANSSTPTATPPIPGATITTRRLVPGTEVLVDVEISQTPTLLGPPYSWWLPEGGQTLRAQIDLSDLGANLDYVSLNIIATTELIFDPTIADPDRNCYDGIGPLGNDAITFTVRDFRTYYNKFAFIVEENNDTTLIAPVTDDLRSAVDIVDWQVSVRRLQ